MKLYIIAILLVLVNSSYGQNNTISIGFDRYIFLNVISTGHASTPPIDIIFIKYARSISPNFDFSVNYSFTSAVAFFGIELVVQELPFNNPNSLGKIVGRRHYNFFDFTGSYSYYITNFHTLSFFFGPSYTYGVDEYLTKLALTAPVGGQVIFLGTELDKEGYWGGVFGLFYNYKFKLINQEFNTGINIQARNYSNDFPFSINYGLQIGYNF